jgi:hypothetical protein
MIGDMRFTWLLTAFLWASTGFAQTVEPGTIVVVWGAVKGCEDWTDRILDLEVVPLEGAIELLGQELNIQGLSGDEVLGQIIANIRGQTGREPTTLRFSIERWITRKLTQAYMNSQAHLDTGTCPTQQSSGDWPGYQGDVPLPVKLELRNIVAHPSTPSKSDRQIARCVA